MATATSQETHRPRTDRWTPGKGSAPRALAEGAQPPRERNGVGHPAAGLQPSTKPSTGDPTHAALFGATNPDPALLGAARGPRRAGRHPGPRLRDRDARDADGRSDVRQRDLHAPGRRHRDLRRHQRHALDRRRSLRAEPRNDRRERLRLLHPAQARRQRRGLRPQRRLLRRRRGRDLPGPALGHGRDQRDLVQVPLRRGIPGRRRSPGRRRHHGHRCRPPTSCASTWRPSPAR